MSDMDNSSVSFRRDVEFFDCNEITKNKRNCDYVFRFGFLEIQQPHFEPIHSHIRRTTEKIEVVTVELATQDDGIAV